jgi:hypothetical protein
MSLAGALAVQLPRLTTIRTILSKWTTTGWSLWLSHWCSLGCLWSLLSQTSLPAWLPWEPSFLIGLNLSGPLAFPVSLIFQLCSFSFLSALSAFCSICPFLSSHLPYSSDRFCPFHVVYWLTFCSYCQSILIIVFYPGLHIYSRYCIVICVTTTT